MSKIIAFPVAARASEIQIAANALCDLHGDAANNFWRLTIRQLRQQLEDSGVGRGECDRELRAFADAVLIRVAETGKPAENERAG